MEDECRDVLASEINDVLRGSLQFQHFMVPGGFKSASLKLISNLDLLVIFGFVVQVVFQLDNEFNGLAQSVHDEFLSSKSLNLG